MSVYARGLASEFILWERFQVQDEVSGLKWSLREREIKEIEIETETEGHRENFGLRSGEHFLTFGNRL